MEDIKNNSKIKTNSLSIQYCFIHNIYYYVPDTFFQCHPCITSFNPQNNPMEKLPLLGPFL